MLRMKSLEHVYGRPAYFGATSTGGGGVWGSLNVTAIFLSGDVHVTSSEYRAPGDYLVQGGPFDDFYNKYVDNDQFSGTVNVPPDFGRGIPEQKNNSHVRVTSNWLRWYSHPPIVITPNGYEGGLINQAPIAFAGGQIDQRKCASTQYYEWTLIKGTPYTCCLRINVDMTDNPAWGSSRKRVTITTGRSGSWYYGWNQSSFIDEGLSVIRSQAQAWWKSHGKTDDFPLIATKCREIANDIKLLFREAHKRWVASQTSFRYDGSNYPNFSLSPETPDFSNLESYRRFLTELRKDFDFDSFDLSRHSREVIEDLNNFDSNLIAYGADLKKTGDTIRSIAHLARNARSPKAWASAWLSGRYGDRLAVSDTKELLESINKRLTTRRNYALARKRIEKSESFGDFDLALTRTSTVIAANESYNDLMTAVHNAMKWDLWPSLENSWDLIPLSFVADWFAPVQDLCGQIDAAIEKPYIKPLTMYIGEKLTVRFLLRSQEMTGVLELKHYVRKPYDVLGDVRPFDWALAPPSFSVVHAADGLALLVQTSKRAR